MTSRVPLIIALALVLQVVPPAAANPVSVSPDGVALHDIARLSTVWTRGYSWDFPEGMDEWELFHDCAAEAASHGQQTTFEECWEPYMTAVWWNDENGQPLQTTQANLEIEFETADFSVSVGDFVIYDFIDGCCGFENKDAEGFVYVTYFDAQGNAQGAPRKQCPAGSSGNCSHTWTLPTALTEHGYKFIVQFYDDDIGGGLGDAMDISIRQGTRQAEVGVPADTFGVSDYWSADFDVAATNPDGEALHACWEQTQGTFCELTGQWDDGLGDEDDAGLDFTLELVE